MTSYTLSNIIPPSSMLWFPISTLPESLTIIDAIEPRIYFIVASCYKMRIYIYFCR